MKNSLLKILDLKSGKEFQYYEDIENLLENDEVIDSGQVYSLLKEVDMSVFAELCENYFDVLTEDIPNGQLDFLTLLNNIGMAMKGMANNCHDDGMYLNLAEEIAKFNKWFTKDKTVTIINDKTREETKVTPCDAITTYRLEKLGRDSYEYYFDNALEYQLDDYILSFKDMIG